jgi:hypothetical protein
MTYLPHSYQLHKNTKLWPGKVLLFSTISVKEVTALLQLDHSHKAVRCLNGVALNRLGW